jgi:hypothetical protein
MVHDRTKTGPFGFGVLALGFGACAGSESAIATGPLPVADLSAVATPWVPVAYGDAQVSIPSSFAVLYPSGSALCAPGSPPGVLYVAPTPVIERGSSCPTGAHRTLVSVIETRQVPPRYARAKPIALNGVTIYLGPFDKLLASYTYYAPSLGVEVTAEGPMAQRIINTLMPSPRARALASAIAPSVAASWQSVSFTGLRFSVPADWPVERTGTWNLCGPVQIAIAQVVTLDTDRKFLALPCPAPLAVPVPPSGGVRVDTGRQIPTGSFSPGGACCISAVSACARPAHLITASFCSA